MLKTNSKKAIQNLKAAMVAYCSGWDEDPKTAEEAAFILAHDFIESEKGPDGRIRGNFQDNFIEWGRGLPNSIFDHLFYFGDAKRILALVLEETEQEAAKFSEDQAAVKFCVMMWIHGGVSEAFYKLYKGW